MNDFSKKWMSYLEGRKKLTEFTIPGTHDSGTYLLDFSGLSRCQDKSIEDQLNQGVRFLDIRLKPGIDNDNALYIAHGLVESGFSFAGDVMPIIQRFLNSNPSETIIMCIKDDSIMYKNHNHKKYFYNAVWSTIQEYHFYTNGQIPSLDKVRGKVVLFRRFWAPGDLSFPVGVNLYGDDDNIWPKDRMNGFENDGINFYVQDRYDDWKGREDIENKFKEAVKPTLEKASSSLPNTLFINFTSGTSGNIFYEDPKEIAEIVNPLFFEYLYNKQKTRFGIIPMDFPESPLINRLYSCNPFNFISMESIVPGNVYEIRPRLDLNKCLDVKGNIQADGTQVIIHTSNNQLNQRWKLADAGDGYFYLHTLIQTATNSVLDVAGNIQANGTNVIIQRQNNGNNQKWKITKLENGYFILEPKSAPNSLLDLFEANTEDGSPVKIFEKSNNDWAEQWALLPVK
ncbi:phosphatidylinositol-specific phospholipase C domain-containing protein [Flavobacterium sp.]|uniref:phosphatidylinositol-specific phospholipase C domain-containing protein n=1 Tax=Flavobacterium sp. TaxID=239 RepID=UPI003A959200